MKGLIWVQLHFPPLITAKALESTNSLNISVCYHVAGREKTPGPDWSNLKNRWMQKKIIDIYKTEKVYEAISKHLGHQWTTVRVIIHKWRKHGTVMNLRGIWFTAITLREQQRFLLNNIPSTAGPTRLTDKIDLSHIFQNILIICRTFGEIFCRPATWNSLFERHAFSYVLCKTTKAFQEKNVVPTSKDDGGVMIWGALLLQNLDGL